MHESFMNTREHIETLTLKQPPLIVDILVTLIYSLSLFHVILKFLKNKKDTVSDLVIFV